MLLDTHSHHVYASVIAHIHSNGWFLVDLILCAVGSHRVGITNSRTPPLKAIPCIWEGLESLESYIPPPVWASHGNHCGFVKIEFFANISLDSLL